MLDTSLIIGIVSIAAIFFYAASTVDKKQWWFISDIFLMTGLASLFFLTAMMSMTANQQLSTNTGYGITTSTSSSGNTTYTVTGTVNGSLYVAQYNSLGNQLWNSTVSNDYSAPQSGIAGIKMITGIILALMVGILILKLLVSLLIGAAKEFGLLKNYKNPLGDSLDHAPEKYEQ